MRVYTVRLNWVKTLMGLTARLGARVGCPEELYKVTLVVAGREAAQLTHIYYIYYGQLQLN